MQKLHVGLIPDGNRRWARARNLPDIEGHKYGSIVLKDAVEFFLRKPEIKELSIFCLSEENFKRSKEELDYLNKIYIEGIEDLRKRPLLGDEQVRVNLVSTSMDKLDPSLLSVFKQINSETKVYSDKILNLLVGYTGKTEIIKAMQSPINKIKNLFFGLKEEDIRKALIVKTPCDFIIRSGFEEAERESKSGFFIWQSAYSENYHLKKNWGDVTHKDLEEAWDYFLTARIMKGK